MGHVSECLVDMIFGQIIMCIGSLSRKAGLVPGLQLDCLDPVYVAICSIRPSFADLNFNANRNSDSRELNSQNIKG
jgi:hypothetical protein